MSRSSSMAARISSGDDPGSSILSSSIPSGCAAEKSAASSSLVNWFTNDFHVAEWMGLAQAKLAESRHLEDRNEGGNHIGHGRGIPHGITEIDAGPDRQQVSNAPRRPFAIQRPGDDPVNVRARNPGQHFFHR